MLNDSRELFRRLRAVTTGRKSISTVIALPPDEHRFLHEHLAAGEMDASGVVRAMLKLVADDEALRDRVAEVAAPPPRAATETGRLLRVLETRGRVAEIIELLPTSPLRERAKELNERWDSQMSRRAKAISCFTAAFSSSFVVLRGVRYLQVAGRLPLGEGLTIKGAHIHHYVWGLLLLMTQGVVVTALDLPTGDLDMRYMFPFAAGLALSLDEFDLLLEITDWPWAQDRRPTLDAMVVAVSLAALAASSRPMWSARPA